ncbi:MAG: hypothetical protein JWP89_6869 [Schlesneria sp.]|nr:hypothetical protein [Schlesneria sp.]
MSHSPRSRRHVRRRTGLRTPRSNQRRWQVRRRHRRIVAPARLTVLVTRDRSVAFSVSLALFMLPFLMSCAHQSAHLQRSTSNQTAVSGPKRPESSGTVRYQGLDYNYSGSTSAHSQNRQIQQKGPP